jgi:hypothetical protein
MLKTRLSRGTVLVRFELPAAVSATSVAVCGDFNDWSPSAHPLTRIEGGSFLGDVELAPGRRWHFRYLLDGHRWENDWAADDYAANVHGGEDSVVDLTDVSSLPAALTSAPSDPGPGPGPGPEIGQADAVPPVASQEPAPKLPRKRAAAAPATKPKKAAAAAESTTGTAKPVKAATKTRKTSDKPRKAAGEPEKKAKPQDHHDAAPAAPAKPVKATTAASSTKEAKAADTPSPTPETTKVSRPRGRKSLPKSAD